MTHLQVEVRMVQKNEFNLLNGQFNNLQAAVIANLLL